MNTTYQKAVEKINQMAKNLTCLDFPWVVEIRHGDGSHLLFQNAKYENVVVDDIRFIFVWTEHLGYHVFFQEDLEWWKQCDYT